MKKSKELACLNNFCDYDLEDIRTPIKLDELSVKSRMVSVGDFTFVDTGYALACPICGKVSGIQCRMDIDKTIDWFLEFGCEHYNETDKTVIED